MGCLNCGIACGSFFEIQEGPYSGIRLEGVQINILRGFASNLDITSPDEVIIENAVVNRLGLGVDGISSIVGWVIDCFERGILTEREPGYSVRWGDLNSFLRLTEDIVCRRGLGDTLAEGIGRASQKMGNRSEESAVLIVLPRLWGYRGSYS